MSKVQCWGFASRQEAEPPHVEGVRNWSYVTRLLEEGRWCRRWPVNQFIAKQVGTVHHHVEGARCTVHISRWLGAEPHVEGVRSTRTSPCCLMLYFMSKAP